MHRALWCVVLLPFLLAAAPVKPKKGVVKPVPFASLMDASCWKLTKAYRSIQPWTLSDSVFEGSDGWIAHNLDLADFVLEGDFLYNGKSEGGVLVRGDAEAWIPWLHGYKMDIDADMPGTGHIHFPYRPQPNPGVVQFPVDVWQHFGIRAVGREVSVKLNGKEVLRFRDDHYRYGRICLEGEKGGVRYRNLKLQRLDTSPPSGARSPYTELFDGATLGAWAPSGSVSAENGVVELDGLRGTSGVRLPGCIGTGTVELDVWCKRPQGSSAAYRIGFASGNPEAGPCFTCRTNRISSCGTGRCTSQFPMFMETTCSECWRFDISGKSVDAFRFGEKVLSCTDAPGPDAGISVSADSCVLLLRGARYKPAAKKAPSK